MKFLKAFWLRLSSPSKAAVGVVLLMGFVGGLLFWGAFNTGMEATNSEEFCSGCHAPIVAEIQETIHYSNRSGVRAICSDCHVPHEWTDKIVRKVQASKELVAHFIGTIDTPEKFQARRAHLAEGCEFHGSWWPRRQIWHGWPAPLAGALWRGSAPLD